MHAGLALGEDSLRASGSSLLVVSRPGDGRTRVGAIGAREFAVVAGRCVRPRGNPHPRSGGRDLGGWPDGGRDGSRRSAPGPATDPPERGTCPGTLARISGTAPRPPSSSGRGPDRSPGPPRGSCSPGTPPRHARRGAARTNLSPEACLNGLTPIERADLRSLFCQMASGTGFRNDLRDFVVRDPADVRLTPSAVPCPSWSWPGGTPTSSRPPSREPLSTIPSTMAPALVRRRPRGPPRGGQDIPRHTGGLRPHSSAAGNTLRGATPPMPHLDHR